MKTSGRILRRWMREGGLSYEDVGKALEVHPVTVRNWEKHGMPKVCSLAFKYAFKRKKSFESVRPFWADRRGVAQW